MEVNRKKITQKIRQIGARGAHFQSRQVREVLGVEVSERNKTAKIHNTLKALVADDILEVIPGPRKRNRYYRVKDEDRLGREFLQPQPASTNGPTSPGAASDRLARIENAVTHLAERTEDGLEEIQVRLDALLAVWS